MQHATSENSIKCVQDALVAYLDIYGFSALALQEDELTTLTQTLHSCSGLLKTMLNELPGAHTLTFSDSVLLTVPMGQHRGRTLSSFFQILRKALDLFLEQRLILRGGVAYGTVSYGPDALLGPPVIRAVGYEKAIRMPLVILPAVEAIKALGREQLAQPKCTYLQLRDGGLIMAHSILPSNVESFLDLLREQIGRFSIEGPYDVARVYSDTLAFLEAHVLEGGRIHVNDRQS